ncbi:hypothetical protein Tco_0464889 [Tanacetum coccineum]
MAEQTVKGWLNDLQDRFDTLFETLAQQRAAVFQQQSDAFEALFGDENNQVVNTIAGDQEDPDAKDKQENQDDPNISVSRSGISESGISGMVPQLRDAKDEPYRAMLDAAALKAELNSLQLQVINDDIGSITSQRDPSYHMQTSEKELVVLKSQLDQESMFRRQEGMLRRQEQQQSAKDAKIQRRLLDPEIKSAFPDITLMARWFRRSGECYALSLGMF